MDLHVIVFGDKTGEVKKWEGKVKVQVLSWEKVESVVGNAPTPVPPSMCSALFFHGRVLTLLEVAADISSAHFYGMKNGVGPCHTQRIALIASRSYKEFNSHIK